MGWHDMNGWDWVWATTMMVLVWGGLAAVVIVAIRRSGPAPAAPPESPEEVLRRRFAHGEIDVDDYRQRLDALQGSAKH